MGENICKQSNKGLVSKITRCSFMQLNIKNTWPYQKIGKRPKQTSLQRGQTDGQQTWKMCSTCLIIRSQSVSHSESCPPGDCSCQAPLSMEFSRQEYWSSHSLLQGIFPTQDSNPGLLHCTQILYHLYPWVIRECKSKLHRGVRNYSNFILLHVAV